MNYDKCPTCGEYDWMRSHTCAPAWEVMPADYGDDETGTVTHAKDAATAAEKHLWAYFSDYDYPSGGMDLKVRPVGGAEWEVYAVDVEMVPEMTARKRKAAQP